MSVPGVATILAIRNRVPGLATAEPSAAFVRWMLRLVTAIIFVAATVIGVQFATAAPSQPPVSSSGSHR
jgi:hypothetical protein